MKLLAIAILFLPIILFSQTQYEATEEFPYGQANPEAPKQITDFKKLIGECQCKSFSLKPDRSWADPVDLTWKWKYIMNGMAIQDEGISSDGNHFGSIRQFNMDSAEWYVHYYSTKSAPAALSTWKGAKREDDSIILYKEQKAPNGMDGYYRLTFSEITDKGYNWLGEWVNKTESVAIPTWKIACSRD